MTSIGSPVRIAALAVLVGAGSSLLRQAPADTMLALAASPAPAQSNPRSEASILGGQVRIDYGRPDANGRDLLALVPPDYYWRLGADDETRLLTLKELEVGGQTVAKGEYTLLGHFKTPDQFDLVLASEVGPGRIPVKIAGRSTGTIERKQEYIESLTIELTESNGEVLFVLSWGPNKISAPFKISS